MAGAATEKRRNRGEGSITQVRRRGEKGAKKDLWMGRVTLSPGNRRSVYGKTKGECLAKMRATLERGGRGEAELSVREFDATARACKCTVKRLATELIDQRPSVAGQDAGDTGRRRPLFEVCFEFDGQE